MDLFYQITPIIIAGILAAMFLIWAYRHNELKRYLRVFFAFVFIVGAILAIPAYILYNKNNESKAKDFARQYASAVNNKMIRLNNDTENNNEIKNYFPNDYYLRNVNDIRTINDTTSILRGERDYMSVSCMFSDSYVEKCDSKELEKEIAINYGISLNIKCAYKVYLYYKVENIRDDCSGTAPITCGKIDGEWFILDDFADNGLLNTLNKLYSIYSSGGNYPSDITDNSDNSSSINNDLSSKKADGYIYDPNKRLSEDDTQKLNEYLTSKFEETGTRMYIVYYDSDDTEEMKTFVQDYLFYSADSPAMAYSRTASDNAWRVDWHVSNPNSISLNENYEQIHTAYLSGGSYYDRLKNAIDKAYDIYNGTSD